ncbi:Conidial development protein fluffy [Beauveria bassiana D1-5]|uniref:Conidial development protein fluffy n=1 Tax=Beauveria bassiana D1-5 TaxID=1245745 RepID=A0A0A2VC49_BEABA|nr:Conidial development protein fluffy [Beauveria bassiana D1-5]
MPRRQSLAHQACELCRQRKRKCNGDGLNPCRACHESGAHCVYFAATRVSKADLREELARLQSINSDNSTLLDAISSRDTSPAQLSNILQRLSDGQSRAEVADMLTQQPDSRDGTSKGSPATSAPTTASPMSPGSRLSITQESFKSSVPSVMTPPTVKSPSETHLQANIGYYRQQLPQLLDAILARDCLSFCPISKPDFARDFESGSGEHFSTALADALLALATLLAREQMVAIIASRSSSSGGGGGGGHDDVREQDLGYSFAQEAIAALYNGAGLPHRIADIQALGILALYCLGCAKMKDGLGFAGDFGAAIAEQWGANQSESVLAHRQTHANIYCAAVSFNSLLPNNPKVIAAKLFEFTEWVYKARFRPEKTLDQAVKVYQDSLQWYESFFAYTSSCTAETPLILFGQ